MQGVITAGQHNPDGSTTYRADFTVRPALRLGEPVMVSIGVVDPLSISQATAKLLCTRHLSLDLFAGAGGGLLAGILLGWRSVCSVEIDTHCQAVLRQRQIDGVLPMEMEIHGDIRAFNGLVWRGRVDVITGGFPCQGISAAGRRAGLADPRSGLVTEMLRIVSEALPPFVFAENSPRLRGLGLDVIASALASLGYVVAWLTLGARHVGAPHERDRLWILAADAAGLRQLRNAGQQPARPDDASELARDPLSWRQAADADSFDVAPRLGIRPSYKAQIQPGGDRPRARAVPWSLAPDLGDPGMADVLADRVERTRAVGNGQVPLVAAVAWRVLCAMVSA